MPVEMIKNPAATQMSEYPYNEMPDSDAWSKTSLKLTKWVLEPSGQVVKRQIAGSEGPGLNPALPYSVCT